MNSENIDYMIARSDTQVKKYLKGRNVFLKEIEKQTQSSLNSLSSGLNATQIRLASSELKITFYHSTEDRNQSINPNYVSSVNLLYKEGIDIALTDTNKFVVTPNTGFTVQLLYSKKIGDYSSESIELELYRDLRFDSLFWNDLYFVEKPNFVELSRIISEFVQITNF